jgi:hypothetical protein
MLHSFVVDFLLGINGYLLLGKVFVKSEYLYLKVSCFAWGGFFDGTMGGFFDAMLLGLVDGFLLGLAEGFFDGILDGFLNGILLGLADGFLLGLSNSFFDGILLGLACHKLFEISANIFDKAWHL